MLTSSYRTNAALRASFNGHPAFDRNYSRASRTSVLPPPIGSLGEEGELLRNDWTGPASAHNTASAIEHPVEILPSNVVKRRAVKLDSVAVEVVQVLTHDEVEFRYRAPFHLLVVYEEGVRRDGETLVDGLPRSTLRDLRRKLTFVPAGHEYREWQRPRVRSRVIFCYFEPERISDHGDGKASPVTAPLPPRLLFEDNPLRNAAIKLASLLDEGSDSRRYCEALAVVVAHELLRVNAPQLEPPAPRGLAAWQRRMVTRYIEEHVAERIPLATLAELAGLSTYRFCRTFKQSFGMPPHRYHSTRRIECAKGLLAKAASSVTDIASTVGFSETSSFTEAFRRATGLTPTAYRQSVGQDSSGERPEHVAR
jgi:AraC family transcriptional regulator